MVGFLVVGCAEGTSEAWTDSFADFRTEGVVECTRVGLFDGDNVVFSVVGGKLGDSVNLLVVGCSEGTSEVWTDGFYFFAMSLSW